ncbi:hypothetical protein LUZ63_019902 [Rhynchospora breviuscula]|uniref:Uncharacterized protein n=1 Tax=Rhynchospora breviuscula TaxID=2022672 RepID=A0A9Q0HJH4_9POAL|nr:hypothetical protein LUZ63_019902 [Rhynchospora breviuscula]
MCILCVVQRWSRRVAAMLPYLVIPLMLLWALSHFLPPAFRFEATSPRIACAAVLLLTLLWYEYLLPRLSAWRARRSARLREMRRDQAIQLQKLRKTATRRCRNCLTPYRDQNPGAGGRFMCSTCGHVSKRPVLELPGHSPHFGDRSRWLCSHFLSTDSTYWLDDTPTCPSQHNSFSVGCKLGKIVSFCTLLLRWLCKRLFGFGSSADNVSADADLKRSKRPHNGSNLQENRTEKARRKAEEKRLARLEKEMIEAEERKQREEMARLVEERIKLRDEKLEAEERSKGSTPVGDRDAKKEADKKRQDRERRREKDRGSSVSNSDCEETDKRSTIREIERNKESDKKVDSIGTCHGTGANKIVQQSTRQKYFSTVAGNFKGFSGASFFGGSNPSSSPSAPSVGKVLKTTAGFGNQSYAVKKEGQIGVGTLHKVLPNGDDKSAEAKINRLVNLEKQPPPPAPKKAWHQLFKRNPVTPTPDQTPTAPNYQNGHFETYFAPPNHYFNAPPIFNRPAIPFPMYSPPNTGLFPPVKDPVPPPPVIEEQEQFEDPSFDPDAIALLGPVSESLDDLPLDLGTGFISSEAGRISKPSPIQSPLSRTRVSDDAHKPFSSVVQDSGSNETGSWQLWGAPLTQNALGSVGGSKSGFVPKEETGTGAGVIGDVHSPRHLGGIRPALAVPVPVPVPVQPVHVPMSVTAPMMNGENLFLPHSMMGRFGAAVSDTVNHSDLSPTHRWSNRDQWRMNGPNEAAKSTPASPRAGSLFSTDPAVQSHFELIKKKIQSVSNRKETGKRYVGFASFKRGRKSSRENYSSQLYLNSPVVSNDNFHSLALSLIWWSYVFTFSFYFKEK